MLGQGGGGSARREGCVRFPSCHKHNREEELCSLPFPDLALAVSFSLLLCSLFSTKEPCRFAG